MKRILSLLALLLWATAAGAQSTSVTVNVTDAGSIAWATGTYSFAFVGDPNSTWAGGNLAKSFTGSLSASGSATVSIPDNNRITPSPSSWTIVVCPNPSVTVTTGCNTTTAKTITGASQTVNITPPAISISVPTVSTQINPVVAYADAEISGGWVGFSYYSLNNSSYHTCTAISANTCSTWVSSSGGVGSAGPLPEFAVYTLYISGGTVYARNNSTGAIDFSGTDAAVVINSAMGNVASTCGTLYFKNGIYPLSSVTQETHTGVGMGGAYSHYYSVGVPANTSATTYCEWHFVGESQMSWTDSNPTQSSGVIFAVQPAAVTAAGASTNEIVAIWQIPDTVNGFGPRLFFDSITVRFPNNQRGCEQGINPWEALDVDYHNVRADFTTAITAVPVAGSCTGQITSNSGLISTRSQHNNIQKFVNTVSVGWDICYEFDSEHFYAEDIAARYCRVPWEVGLAPSGANNIFQSGYMVHPITLQCIQDMIIGGNVVQGTRVDIFGLGIEYNTTGIWTRTTLMQEVNHGYTSGLITYGEFNATTGVFVETPVPFASGSGANFLVLESTAPPAGIIANRFSDTFNRPNASTLGPVWITPTGGTGGLSSVSMAITSSAAASTASNDSTAYYNATNFNGDQFSQGTVNACDGSGVEVWVRESNTGNAQGYRYFYSTTAHIIQKFVSGTKTTLVTSPLTGCSAGDVVELDVSGNTLVAKFTHSGTTTIDIVTSDTSVTSGNPGIGAGSSANGFTTVTVGNLPTNNGTASIYGDDSFRGIPRKSFVTTADYTNATTGFTSVIGVGAPVGLAFPVAANTSYTMHCSIVWSASAATTGPQFQITGPASPTSVSINMISAITATTTASAGTHSFSSAMNPVGATVTSATDEMAHIDMNLVNGANAGTVQLQAAAQGTGTLTIRQGSSCTLE